MSSREQFEAWASKQKLGLTYGDCGYVFSSTEMAWRAWQAMESKYAAQARNEGINYAAGRLAAAFNHGFVDKPLTEVCDVVRMILDTKEDLANSTLPAADGLSGEYAEKFLEEFAAQLRQDANTAELVAAGIITKVGE